MREMCLAMVVLSLGSLTLGHAASYDFDNGQVPSGHATSMKIPPKVVDGRLRITGNYGDNDSIPSSFPSRVRATKTLTSHFSSMPILSQANQTQSYSAVLCLRLNTTSSPGISLMEWYQDAPGGEGYGEQNGQGPPARFTWSGGRIYFETRYRNETKVDNHLMGSVANGSCHRFSLRAVWSHQSSEARLEASMDGNTKVITGRDVNLGPASNRLPMLKFGLYGDHAVGTLDVDDVRIGSAGAEGPSTPHPSNPPVVVVPPPSGPAPAPESPPPPVQNPPPAPKPPVQTPLPPRPTLPDHLKPPATTPPPTLQTGG